MSFFLASASARRSASATPAAIFASSVRRLASLASRGSVQHLGRVSARFVASAPARHHAANTTLSLIGRCFASAATIVGSGVASAYALAGQPTAVACADNVAVVAAATAVSLATTPALPASGAAPTVVANAVATTESAVLLSRLGALVVDSVVTNIMFSGVVSVFGVVSPSAMLTIVQSGSPLAQFSGILGTLLICRFAVQLACDYFFAMLGRQSLGKTMFGIAVVDSKTKSTKLGRRQMLVREIVKTCLPFYFYAAFHSRSRCIHDLVAGTEVIVVD